MQIRNHTLRATVLFAGVILAAASSAQAGLWVELKSNTRSQQDVYDQSDQAQRTFNENIAKLVRRQRLTLIRAGLFNYRIPLSFPTVVRLARGGRPLPPPDYQMRAGGDIVLQFDTTGNRAFSPAYRAQLQAAFDQAKATMNLVFGMPSQGGTVLVKNYDADIGDRDAVSGGYIMPNNGSGQREIRFPVYVSPEAAAVNFIHCCLLAYLGTATYAYDAFEEGLVRAAVTKIVRTPGALPANLSSTIVENVLENTYDVSAFYDWWNQRALGGAKFIAPNLRNDPLPAGGSFGGLYLLRYQMSGTAWNKCLVENAGFIAEFNRRFYLNPAVGGNVPFLIQIGQAALDTVKGAQNSTVEGLSFAEWFKRQYILETQETLGRKLLVQPLSLIAAGGDDFGVFDVSATYFQTNAGGDEVLLSGTSFPIFFEQDGNRMFPTGADQIQIAGSFGSVTPNFPDINGGQPYRTIIDIPVLDRVARAIVPSGAISTANNIDPNNFYGTVSGLPSNANVHLRLTIGATVVDNIPVTHLAFGMKVPANTGFEQSQRLKVEVIQTVNTLDQVKLTRFVNKSTGALGLDLRVDGEFSFITNVSKGIQTFGLPIEAFESSPADLLGVASNQLLMGRYNASKAAYDFYPDTGAIEQGQGYFLRLDTAKQLVVQGRTTPLNEVGVALRPGWNLIATPINEVVPTNHIRVIRGGNVPSLYVDSAGVDIGTEFFAFQKGPNDGATGVPETGTMVSATTFQPGQAYFVQCLAPEGVTMYFAPNASAKPRVGHGFKQTGWRLQITAVDNQSRAAAIIGQSNTGTGSFDTREDSELPPTQGGLQVLIKGARNLYKDVRRIGQGDTYHVRLEGLVPGHMYTVNFKTVLGTLTSFGMLPTGGYYHSMKPGNNWQFRAGASYYELDVMVNGGSR